MKTVLFFTQKSCGPCRQIEPSIIQLCQQSGAKLQYVQVDTEEGKQTAQSAGEISTPVCIVLDDTGSELTRLRNAQVILDGLPSALNIDTQKPPIDFKGVIGGAIIGGVIGRKQQKTVLGTIIGGVLGDIIYSNIFKVNKL
jgi:thiol-disulfide isomerase/thioredoxin